MSIHVRRTCVMNVYTVIHVRRTCALFSACLKPYICDECLHYDTCIPYTCTAYMYHSVNTILLNTLKISIHRSRAPKYQYQTLAKQKTNHQAVWTSIKLISYARELCNLKFSQAVCKILCSQTFLVQSQTHRRTD